MKKIINILLITIHFAFALDFTDQFWESNNETSPSLMNRIDTNHYFSMLGNSSNGSFDTYGIYGNLTRFTLNNRTQLYTNFSIMHPMSSEYSNSDKLNYSIGMGMKYQLSDNAFLSVGMIIMESYLEQYSSPLSYNQYNDSYYFKQYNSYLP